MAYYDKILGRLRDGDNAMFDGGMLSEYVEQPRYHINWNFYFPKFKPIGVVKVFVNGLFNTEFEVKVYEDQYEGEWIAISFFLNPEPQDNVQILYFTKFEENPFPPEVM